MDTQRTAFFLTNLTLTCFRNHRDFSLRLDSNLGSAPIVITGENGSGKTNVLEAISLLVPGRGLRRATASEWQQREQSHTSWAIAAECQSPSGPVRIGTGRDPEDSSNQRRVVHIDGRLVRGQHALAEHVTMVWITPEMDRILSDGAATRRKWLDRLVYGFDPAHAGRVQRYEKALRERLQLLREGGQDAAWLTALEDILAQSGVAIAAARLQLLRQLRTTMQETARAFPHADLNLRGVAEESLMGEPALLVEDKLRAALRHGRNEDAQNGTSALGPHRSDFIVVHRAKNMPADLCSTGEQKTLLIAIMFAYVRALATARGVVPLLLLDDIAAHLDHIRRKALFEEILALRTQAWLTGTDRAGFEPLQSYAQNVEI